MVNKFNFSQIALLKGCNFKQLSVRLNMEYLYAHAALSIDGGKKGLFLFLDSSKIRSKTYNEYSAIICFDIRSKKNCELFNGIKVQASSGTSKERLWGQLGIYNGRPTAIGGEDAKGAVETLTENGWLSLPVHPR